MVGESRGLGRGLQALLGSQPLRPAGGEPPALIPRGVESLPLTAIQTGPSQPRRSIQQEPLEELAASIKAKGVIQPIVVRPIVVRPVAGAPGKPTYEIVAGERRWQAAKLAGLTVIPVVIREVTDGEAVALALIENIQREQLTPAEEARSLKRLAEEFALTHGEVATAVGRSRAAVSNLIRLLDLPEQVVALIDSKALSMGHARALLGLEEDAERMRVASVVVERSLSVRETEELVRRTLEGEGRAEPKTAERAAVSQVLRTAFASVTLRQKASGAGRLVVEFKDSVTRDEAIRALQETLDDDHS